MSKLNEAIMRELESLCAPWVILREQRHGDGIRGDVWVGSCSPHVARVLEDGI